MKEGKDYTRIIFFVLMGICLFTIVFSSINVSFFTPIRNGISVFLVPIQKTVNSFGKGVVRFVNENRDLKKANETINQLTDEINEKIEENNKLKADNYELARLRKLYELDQEYLQYPKVACRVIAKDSQEWFQVFRIDKGRKDGIKENMNVLSGGGLLGIVIDVGENYATVRSIIDDSSRVTAMTQHSNAQCIVEGDVALYNTGFIRLTHIDLRSSITDGDKIVSSNISSKYLPGILIGYASDVKTDESQLSKAGLLVPVADFNNLSEVLVITKTKDEYLKDAEEATKKE